jgi:type I restriction enzyme S subunit
MGLLRINREKVTPEYLLYAYLSPAFQQTIKANTITGATVDRIALTELPSFSLRVPPLEEQKKVAKLLSNIDKKIELNNRINAELEAMAKTLYDYWFIQFDFPDANGKPYKTSGGKMVYNAYSGEREHLFRTNVNT